MEVDLLALEPKPEGTKDPPGGGAPTHKTATFCAMIDLFFVTQSMLELSMIEE